MKITRRTALKWGGAGVATLLTGKLIQNKCTAPQRGKQTVKKATLNSLLDQFNIPRSITNHADIIEYKINNESNRLLVIIGTNHNYNKDQNKCQHNVYQLLERLRRASFEHFFTEAPRGISDILCRNVPPNPIFTQATIDQQILRGSNGNHIFLCLNRNRIFFHGVDDLSLWIMGSSLVSSALAPGDPLNIRIFGAVSTYGQPAIHRFVEYRNKYISQNLSKKEIEREFRRIADLRSSVHVNNAMHIINNQSIDKSAFVVGKSHLAKIVSELSDIKISYLALSASACNK